MGGHWKLSTVLLTVAGLAGCANVAPELAIDDVAQSVETRTGQTIHWETGGPEDEAARAYVKRLLSKPLTSQATIQIALLNNRDLQAAYTGVGIAQANLVQAGLLKNPVLDGAVTWFTDAGGTPNVAFGVAWSFITLFQKPLREAVAASELEEAKILVARRVIKHAADTYAGYVSYVAARQEAELMSQVVRSARASVAAAKALREAGNITALQFDRQNAFLSQAKLELAQAEAREAEAREALNVLMGLTGADTRWRAPNRLSDIPRKTLDSAHIERRTVARSLDIAAGRQRLITLGRRFQLVKQTSLIPDLDIGADYDREVDVGEGDKNIRKAFGPSFGIEIPIFDYGQAKKAGAYLQIRQAEAALWALAVRVRSAARLTRARLLHTRKTAVYYRDVVLPQSQRILAGAQRDYNAMQLSVFQLVAAKRQQITAGRQYIQALRAYWNARVRFYQLMSGSLPEGGTSETTLVAEAAGQAEDAGGH